MIIQTMVLGVVGILDVVFLALFIGLCAYLIACFREGLSGGSGKDKDKKHE